jgi:hypothetical protein
VLGISVGDLCLATLSEIFAQDPGSLPVGIFLTKLLGIFARGLSWDVFKWLSHFHFAEHWGTLLLPGWGNQGTEAEGTLPGELSEADVLAYPLRQ